MKQMATLIKLILVLAALHSSVFAASTVYIVPSTSDCSSASCLTLSEFATSFIKYFDAVLFFEEGDHYLESNLTISYVSEFRMLSNHSSAVDGVNIICKQLARFEFSNVAVVTVSGVNFLGCVENKVRSVKRFDVSDVSFTGQKDKTGMALEIINSSAKLIGCTFNSNQGSKLHPVMCSDSTKYRRRKSEFKPVYVRGGGAIVSRGSKIHIIQSRFEGNSAQVGGAIFIEDNSHISVRESTFIENSATFIDSYDKGVCLAGGGAMHVESNSFVTILESHFIDNKAHYFGGTVDVLLAQNVAIKIYNSDFTDSRAKYGGVLNVLGTYKTVITINNTKFRNNSAEKDGGVVTLLANPYLWFTYSITMTITSSQFIKNSAGDHGGVMDVSNTENSALHFINSNFISNSAREGGGVISAGHNEKINITLRGSKFHYNEATVGGVLMFYENYRLNRVSADGNLFQSNAAHTKGGVLYSKDYKLNIEVKESIFKDSTAEVGGAMYLYHGKLFVANSTFANNSAVGDGGALNTIQSEMVITVGSKFEVNSAGGNGGTICTNKGRVFINDSSFTNNLGTNGGVLHTYHTYSVIAEVAIVSNRAIDTGGAMHLVGREVIIMDSSLCNNEAGTNGGVIQSHQSNLVIFASKFSNNRAEDRGGVLNVDQGEIQTHNNLFTNNSANRGGVLWADHATVSSNGVNVTRNQANLGVVYHIESTAKWTNARFTSNNGSLCAIESSVTLKDIVMTGMSSRTSHQRRRKGKQMEEGGAITAFQGTVNFYGNNILRNNTAQTGGAIHAIEAMIIVHDNITVANNKAIRNGGGIYLKQSELTCQRNSTLTLQDNSAREKGGGIHALGSSIKINGTLVEKNYATLRFIDNEASEGGGLYLQLDAKLYVLKSKAYTEHYKIVAFIENSADYGGAVYVSDDGVCNSKKDKECFFQSLALYSSFPIDSVHKSIHFSDNMAKTAGNGLFGGLLDQCVINPLAELDVHHFSVDSESDDFLNESIVTEGLEYLQMVSNMQDSDINSPPVRVCFCRNGHPDCNYQPDPISIIKGQVMPINLSLAVLDQLNRPLEKATVYNRLSSGLDVCQYHVQKTTDGNCSVINIAVAANNETEELIFFTDGPCKDKVDCQCRVKLEVFCPHCPIGFQLTEGDEGCRCECDSKLKPFVSECLLPSQSVVRKQNCWITNISNTNATMDKQYLIYPHCPMDYCLPSMSKVKINLNLPNGSDAQCANGRSGLLCGTCEPGLSLSLGSSRCIPCSTLWPVHLGVVILGALVAGIFLVALVFVLNLTVAIGTLNGIIFYANIVVAQSNTFLPFSSPNFPTVFISWLNLDIGLDVCFFDGLNSFWKTWLQLVFPAYIILLVILITIISEFSPRFAKLIGKRNPVATLATLILLSYAKILHSIIASLSFATLKYPDGSHRMVWLPNASVGYLQGKHFALFLVAILILLVGLVYTFLLFSWQWLNRHNVKKLFTRKKYQKLCHFIEPYHAPYTFKHRYWTGMLLLVRVFVYITSAINIHGDPRVTYIAIIFTVTTLLLMKGSLAKNLYKNQLVDFIETITYFNLVIFTTLTLYTFDHHETNNQAAVAYTSVATTFILLLVVLVFHVYRYTVLYSLLWKTKFFRAMGAKYQAYQRRNNVRDSRIETDSQCADYARPRPRLNPTQSVVDLQNLSEEAG